MTSLCPQRGYLKYHTIHQISFHRIRCSPEGFVSEPRSQALCSGFRLAALEKIGRAWKGFARDTVARRHSTCTRLKRHSVVGVPMPRSCRESWSRWSAIQSAGTFLRKLVHFLYEILSLKGMSPFSYRWLLWLSGLLLKD